MLYMIEWSFFSELIRHPVPTYHHVKMMARMQLLISNHKLSKSHHKRPRIKNKKSKPLARLDMRRLNIERINLMIMGCPARLPLLLSSLHGFQIENRKESQMMLGALAKQRHLFFAP